VISEQLLTNVVTHAAKAHDDVSFELTLNHMLDAFCLGQNLPFCDQPIQWLFKELSVQVGSQSTIKTINSLINTLDSKWELDSSLFDVSTTS
jgi:hypothetical protein